MRDNTPLQAGVIVILALLLVSWLAPWIASSEREDAIIPFGPMQLDAERILEPPSSTHWLGTDQVGRDLLSRLLHGGRRSLATGLVATLVAILLATCFGAMAGVIGGGVDVVFSRVSDIVYAFPVLVGAIALLGLSTAGLWMSLPPSVRVGAVIGLFSWPFLYRFLRGEFRRWFHSEMADAARAIGCSRWRLALWHLLPAAALPALVPASFLAAGSILVEAGLGFLGIGILPPEPSWGNLILDGMKNVDLAWWLVLFPGLFVFTTVLAFHLLGEGLRRRLTP